MNSTLKSYLEKCRTIFSEHHQKLSQIIPFPGTPEPTQDNMRHFEAAISEAENTEEFAAFAKGLGAGPLGPFLEKLTKKEESRRKKERRKTKNIDKLKHNTECHAAKAFFRNTGTYLNLWQFNDIEESELITTLNNYNHESELIRLFVFDGFVPFNGKKSLNSISLPVGELKKYTEDELENLLMHPQSSWHGIVNPQVIKKAATWHILAVREKSEFRGISGLWMDGVLLTHIDLSETGWPARRESDIEIIGPVFLYIGEDANLATEIRVRTNIFEYSPVLNRVRNDYLPWDSYDEEGEPGPRTFVKYLGESGKNLRKVCEIWKSVNEVDADGLLRYPTEAYVRSVMNLHTSWESLMETFVGFVTVIESLLTPGSRQELAYKMAVRGAALLASDPEHRMRLFQILDEFYKTRSQIVHEGRTDKNDPYELNNIISLKLTEISRQIFLRYICLLNMGLSGELPEGLVLEPGKLSSRNSRPKIIARILDGLVLDPSMTVRLEKRMEEWGVYEDWIRKTSLRLSLS